MDLNCYLPRQECQFMHQVRDELERFQEKDIWRRVLLFPPLPSRLRYLIHSHVEDLPKLATFSVGESWYRRVVICHSELRGDAKENTDLESEQGWYEEPQRNGSRKETEANSKPKSAVQSRMRGPKRPDKPLYMPRAARERHSLQGSQEPLGDTKTLSNSFISDSPDSYLCPESTETSSSTFRDGCLPTGMDSNVNSVQNVGLGPPEVTGSVAEPQNWDQTVGCFADLTLDSEEKEKEDGDSEGYSDVIEEIKAQLKNAVAVSIENVQNDYSLYMNVSVSINLDEFRHVIEIYGFPHVLTTEDLLNAFTEYSDGGMKIKWIDNTHALGVFSCEAAALQALSISHPMLKVRALSEGSKKAKAKAIISGEFLQPVKERPRTDCAVAQRMVTRALGLQRRSRAQQVQKQPADV
ncbi:uncharacterized protein V6R79_018169 [Siganus canaliculatus]